MASFGVAATRPTTERGERIIILRPEGVPARVYENIPGKEKAKMKGNIVEFLA